MSRPPPLPSSFRGRRLRRSCTWPPSSRLGPFLKGDAVRSSKPPAAPGESATAVPKTITELYAWVATIASGDEGLPAVSIVVERREMMAPIIGADRERVESLREHAELAKVTTGAPMRLCRFELVEEIEEL
jgi:hypothetical protein